MLIFRNVNEAVIKISDLVTQEGVWRETRGFKCLEYPSPVHFCITNPKDRILSLPVRKWKAHLAYAESLWLALGYNNLDALTGNYAKSLYNYSDDGKTWRAGYGTRFRHWVPSRNQYPSIGPGYRPDPNEVDQFKFVVDSLQRDPNSRQALITIADPGRDCFTSDNNLIVTNDMPCSRSLHFQRTVDGKLDMIVHMRSNDLEFGMGGVNIFNFTMMQEYFAAILKMPIGRYHHIVDNLHVYADFVDKAKTIAKITDIEEDDERDEEYAFDSLHTFDTAMGLLYQHERHSSGGRSAENPFKDTFIHDWYEVLRVYWLRKYDLPVSPEFTSPKLAAFIG
jgi:thymidylate synthase